MLKLLDVQKIAAGPELAVDLLDGLGQPVLVLNEDRDILHANQAMRSLVDIKADLTIGQLPGEALGCIHANDSPAGCGSSDACQQCGIFSATQSCLQSKRRSVSEARLTVTRAGKEVALDLEVTASALATGSGLVLLSFRDVGAEKRRQVLERLFFHDLLNLAGGLSGLLQAWPDFSDEQAVEIQRLASAASKELLEEIDSGRALSAAERGDLEVKRTDCDVSAILGSLASAYQRNSVAEGRQIVVTSLRGAPTVHTDPTLLRRVLGNLLKNALEATSPGGIVTLSFHEFAQPTFCVHNPGTIPASVAAQMFHRSFSTKGESGRGIGSYSVKLLTERYLRGSVSFVSLPEEGTTFAVRLPSHQPN